MNSSLYLFLFKRLLFLLSCFNLITMRINSSSSMQPQCHEDESSALLQFKHSFIINEFSSGNPSAYPKMESWKLEGENHNCCSWYGVECDEISGHVIGLDLSSSFLYGSINSNSSLFSLVHLQRLNLAENHFNYSKIPSGFGHLSRLTSLNLSHSVFVGQIPSEISELSNLESLDLSSNLDPFSSHGLLKLQNPSLKSLVQNFTNLKELYLTNVSIYSAVPDVLANFSSLTGLALEDCGLYGEFPRGVFLLPKIQYLSVEDNINLTGHLPEYHHSSPLEYLSLRSTSFSGKLPDSIGNLESLNTLNFRKSNFFGRLPSSLGNLTQLTFLDLGMNYFSGLIPSWLTNLTQLTCLILDHNQLQGPIPSLFNQLKRLEVLHLPVNKLSGTVEMDTFLQLQNSSWRHLSGNKLTVLSTKNNTNTTVPKLNILGLNACNLKEFPDFLQFQDELVGLGLALNEIHGQIPTRVWNSSKETMAFLDVRYNFLTGFDQLPAVIPCRSLIILDLEYNRLQGSIPIPPKSIQVYSVANNMLSGKIPSSFCHMNFLHTLDFSNNNLIGKIPQCLATVSVSMILLNLSGNGFQGAIPEMFPTDSQLKMIDFSRNQLQGKVPRTLSNCTKLLILVLGNNQINDTFPVWLGALPELQVLILGYNKFHGAIESPNADPEFPKLHIIDLSHNGFSGNLPSEYFKKWKAMKMLHAESIAYMQFSTRSLQFSNDSQHIAFVLENNYSYSITITLKGTQRLYEKIRNAFVAIDLSSNEFRGEIPESLGNLKGLQSLNLSNNELIGRIPSSLGNLTNLESLDLCQNMLSGKIPQQLTQLTFLAVLDVSHNHLTGPIPRGPQFNTFVSSSFEGNSGLCGEPLSKKCENSEASSPPPSTFQQVKDSEFPSGIDWIIIILGYGSGLTVGLVIGHSLTTRNHDWFVKTFGRRQQRRQNKRVRRS